MPVFKRNDMPKLLKAAEQGDVSQIYLIFGERFLCRNAADELVNRLLPPEGYQDEQKSNHLMNIDGDQEDMNKTLHLLRTYSLFPGRQIFRVNDTRLFYSKGVAKTLWDKTNKAFATQEFSRAGRFLRQFINLVGLSPADPEAEDIPSLSSSRWKELFGFAKPQQNLSWLKDILNHLKNDAGSVADKQDGGDASGLFIKVFQAGIPKNNILILLAETVDKRKQFYKYIKENGVILDLSVDIGSGSAARADQEKILKELVQKILTDFNKKLEPRALPMLLERVGFHPVAAVKETEKLALYAGEATTITANDLNVIIGRTREEALYELTEAFTKQRLVEALITLARLLENGIHGLAILAAFRNHIKKMLLIRSFQELREPSYRAGLSFPAFQKNYLPALKAGREDWSILWRGHPYALYKMFHQTEHFSLSTLKKGLAEVLTAEYRIKGSAAPVQLILEDLVFKLIPACSPDRVGKSCH